jgi:NADH-quinone oxidoreductase subunit N
MVSLSAAGLRFLAPEMILLAAAAAAMFVHLFFKAKGRRWAGYVALAGLAASAVALALTPAGEGAILGGHLARDPFSFFFKMVILLAGALSILFAFRFYDVEGHEPGEVYYLILLSTVGMMASISALDLVTLYVSFELFAIPSYVLAGIFKKELRSGEAGIKYFFLGTLSSAVMLLGMALVFGLTGETGYLGAGQGLAGSSAPVVLTAMTLFFVGLFFKAAFVPFHMWAPDVYEGAPTALVIFLSTAPKAAVLAILIRSLTALFSGFDAQWSHIFQFIALATMFWGNLAALAQKSAKRMLAYSSIAQAGYLAIGLAAWSDDARVAVLFYVLIYVFMNAAAFGLVLLVDRGGRFGEDVDDLRGLARRAPLAAASLIVILLALAGIPPTAGFMGKYLLFAAALRKGMYLLAVAGALNSAISLFYYFRIGKAMFLEDGPDASAENFGTVSPLVTTLLVLSAAVVLLFGLLPSLLLPWASRAVIGL